MKELKFNKLLFWTSRLILFYPNMSSQETQDYQPQDATVILECQNPRCRKTSETTNIAIYGDGSECCSSRCWTAKRDIARNIAAQSCALAAQSFERKLLEFHRASEKACICFQGLNLARKEYQSAIDKFAERELDVYSDDLLFHRDIINKFP